MAVLTAQSAPALLESLQSLISHVTIISEQTLDVHREQEQHTPRQRHTAETAQVRRQRTTENAQKTH